MNAPTPPVVIVSNRGPVSFALDDGGGLVTRRAGGGLATALGAAVAGTGATWIAAALSEADRVAAAEGTVDAEGFRLRSLVVDEDRYRAYYDVVSNATLWFLHHGLWDSPRRPRFDRRWREAWTAYREVNHAFADAVADEAADGATVLVHDYHLSLVGARLAERRPDLATVHFNHTPFCGADAIRALPDGVAEELLLGLAGHAACGFHNQRWASAFEACCEEVLGSVPTRTFVAPAAADPDDIGGVAGGDACARALAELDEQVGDRALIVRVDRIELSKNLLRGFHAFDDLLREHPEWRERVVFAAFVYPSREGLPEYLAYRQEVEGLIRAINERWSTPGWIPVLYDPEDDFPRSVAALRRYDVLLVNPVRDGLNLVAKEGPLVNEHHGVLALSRESGVWAEMAGAALGLNPFDVAGTSDVLHEALTMTAGQRRDHAAAVRAVAAAGTPADWYARQLDEGAHGA
ncbi:MAG TPA: trehalose-6-phosphate synthase [Acidimicrobiales bacterium]|nr:trehalose-6-phosphate synthase [Acidimicrobiales bacterium]